MSPADWATVYNNASGQTASGRYGAGNGGFPINVASGGVGGMVYLEWVQ